MAAYCHEVRKLESKFDGLRFTQIVRDKNYVADESSKMGSSIVVVPPSIFLHVLDDPSIKVSPKGQPALP